MAEYTICTSRKIHHIENCGACFGFGVTASGAPITAGAAHAGKVLSFAPCPECGSTPAGITTLPTTAYNEDATASAQMNFAAWDILSDEALMNFEQGLA